MMINIGICDDNSYFLDYIEDRIINTLKYGNICANAYKFVDGIELLRAYDNKDKPFDIIFLDIDMPKKDGIEIAELIRKRDEEVLLIFITSMDDEVYKVFKYNTFRYIRKTHIDMELEEALNSAVEKLEGEKHVFKTICGDVALYISDILYFEFMDRVVQIQTFHGKHRTTIRRFKDVEDVFIPKGFIPIHRSCLVNERYIKSIGNLDITLDNEEKLPVSRYRLEEVKRSFISTARRG
jgi:two-component system response regulator LytT